MKAIDLFQRAAPQVNNPPSNPQQMELQETINLASAPPSEQISLITENSQCSNGYIDCNCDQGPRFSLGKCKGSLPPRFSDKYKANRQKESLASFPPSP